MLCCVVLLHYDNVAVVCVFVFPCIVLCCVFGGYVVLRYVVGVVVLLLCSCVFFVVSPYLHLLLNTRPNCAAFFCFSEHKTTTQTSISTLTLQSQLTPTTSATGYSPKDGPAPMLGSPSPMDIWLKNSMEASGISLDEEGSFKSKKTVRLPN